MSVVEAAAKALAKQYAPRTPWASWSEHAREFFIASARAVLEAAGVQT